MNIFMLVNYTPSDLSLGITKKISSEIAALRRLGYEVTYTTYCNDGICIYNNGDKLLYHAVSPLKSKALFKYTRYFFLITTAQKFFESTKAHYDIFYGRLLAPSKRYLKLLKSFYLDNSTVVLEAHGYFPGINLRSLKGKYTSYLLKKNGPKLKNYVDRILTEGHIDDFYGIRTVKETAIGVETNQIKPHCYIGNKNEVHLMSVANETKYHAYDRIINSLFQYYKVEDSSHAIFLHLVGAVSGETKKLIERLKLEDKVTLYGKKSGKELDEIYDQCNVGLGPLGQHRVGGKKDTGLKTKEYFAKGLPYIYSGDEPTVPDGYPYICKFPSDESLIDLDQVWNFYQSYANDPDVTQKMRAFAAENYSWDKIMSDALSHLDEKTHGKD